MLRGVHYLEPESEPELEAAPEPEPEPETIRDPEPDVDSAAEGGYSDGEFEAHSVGSEPDGLRRSDSLSEPEAEAEPEPAATGPQGSIGIELGTDKCVVAASSVRRAATAILVRNDVSNEATPSFVGFKGPERFVGEEALTQYARNCANTVSALPGLLGAESAPAGASFQMEEGQAVLDYALGDDAGPSKLRPELLLATLLRKLGQESAVSRTVADNFGADVAQSGYTLTLAVPSYFSPAQCAAAADAAKIAGLPDATIVPCHVALAAQYTCRHAKDLVQLKPGKDEEPGDCRTVLFVDCGAAQVTASVADFTVESVVGGMVIKTRPKGTIRAVASDATIGSAAVDTALFAHLAAEAQEKHGELPKLGTRVGVRLLTQCEKAKKVLSSVAETQIICENLVMDTDARFKVERSTLESLCESLTTRIQEVVASAIGQAGVSAESLHAVELVGGGVRAPMVQRAVQQALGGGGAKLSYTLDSASATAVGAACLGAGLSGIEIVDSTRDSFVPGGEGAPGLGEALVAELAAKELAMVAQTEAQQALGAARSTLESYLYEFRNTLDCGPHKELLDRQKLSPLLDSAEEWLYSEAAEVRFNSISIQF